jgi:Fur family peroxide stress response transcriptional regulator
MSFATVYNTLDALAGCGLTGSLNLGGAVRFDPNTAPHHHAVCDSCGVVIDIPLEPKSELAPPEAARQKLREAAGFRVLREERTYRGLCHRCIGPAAATLS